MSYFLILNSDLFEQNGETNIYDFLSTIFMLHDYFFKKLKLAVVKMFQFVQQV